MVYTGENQNQEQYHITQHVEETVKRICSHMISANNTSMRLSSNQRREVTEIVKDLLDQQTFTDAIKRMLNEANMIAYSQRVISEQAPGIIDSYAKKLIPELTKKEIISYGKDKVNSWFTKFLKSDDIEKFKRAHLDEITKLVETHTQKTITQMLKTDARLNPVFSSLENITRERCDEKINDLTKRFEDKVNENEKLLNRVNTLETRNSTLETRNVYQTFGIVVWLSALTVYKFVI